MKVSFDLMDNAHLVLEANSQTNFVGIRQAISNFGFDRSSGRSSKQIRLPENSLCFVRLLLIDRPTQNTAREQWESR